jgi:hypothetical protein
VVFAEPLPSSYQALLRELAFYELCGPRARIDPGLVLARRLTVRRWFRPELHRRGPLAPDPVHEDPVHDAQRPRPQAIQLAQLCEPRKQAHEQLLHQVFGAIRRAGPAISRAIQRGHVLTHQPLELRGVAGRA